MFGHRLAQRGEPLPRVLGQEPQRHVVRRAAPRLEAPQLRRRPRDVPGDREQVAGADPGREQRLVRVAERRVGDRDRLSARAAPGRTPPGPAASSACRVPSGAGTGEVDVRQLAHRVDRDRRRAVRLVDGHVGEVGQQLGAAVGRRAGGEQLRVVLDERGGDVPGPEVRVVEDRLQERDVRGHAADPELRDRPPGPVDRGREVPAAAGELGQHRVEVRADLGAGVRRPAVEPHAGAAGGAVRRDPAGVRTEPVGGVLGGDPALQRRAAQRDPCPGTARGPPSVSPDAIRIWACTRSTSVTSSVTVCSTWIRGFISMKT